LKRKDGELYYKVSEVAQIFLNLCPTTLFNYLKIDRQMKKNGEEGFLPNSTRINNVQHFKQSEVKEIRAGIAKLKRGDLQYRTKETTYQRMKQENERLKKKLAELEGGRKSENN